jgi:hypothetical protein
MVSQAGQVQKRSTYARSVNEPCYTQTMHIHYDTDGLPYHRRIVDTDRVLQCFCSNVCG